MEFPLSLLDISIWIAVMAIILLVTSELLTSYSGCFGDFLIDKKHMRLAALILGVAFIVIVILRIISPSILL